MSIRAEVISITVKLRLEASAAMSEPSPSDRAVISVPSPSGRWALTIRTGIFLATAGCIASGWSTFAPK